MEKQQISIQIGERSYHLEIEPEMEETIRKAVKNLNGEMQELLRTYDIRPEEALSMILLREEYNLIQARESNDGNYGRLISELNSIDSKLEEYLRSR